MSTISPIRRSVQQGKEPNQFPLQGVSKNQYLTWVNYYSLSLFVNNLKGTFVAREPGWGREKAPGGLETFQGKSSLIYNLDPGITFPLG